MKVRTLILFTVLEITLVWGTPYAPRGYRPPGRQFELPNREYNTPQLSTATSLPTLDPIDFRGGQETLRSFSNNQFDVRQGSFYGAPRDQTNFNGQNNRQFNRQGASINTNGLPNFAQEYGTPNVQGDDTATIQTGGSGRNQQGIQSQYGSPDESASVRDQQTQVNTQRLEVKDRLYQAPTTEFSKTNDDDDIVGGGNQNFVPLQKPRNREPVEPQDFDSGDSTLAISNAVARGQYYLLQPSSSLQRIGADDFKSSGLSARLVYQNTAPFAAPLYGYNSPLIRIL